MRLEQKNFNLQQDWIIEENGDLSHLGIPEYTIPKEMLNSNIDWIKHLSEKSWFDISRFIIVYNIAKNA